MHLINMHIGLHEVLCIPGQLIATYCFCVWWNVSYCTLHACWVTWC